MTIRGLARNIRESRAMAGMPNGWGWTDPTAVPPPGIGQFNSAGVPVTPETAMQVDATFNALRVLCNSVTKLGNLRAYKIKLDEHNQPYQEWLPDQPPILTNPYGAQYNYDGRRQTTVALGLFGHLYMHVLTRDYYEFPTSVKVLNPALMDHQTDPKTGADVFLYGSGMNRVQLANEDMVSAPFMGMPGQRRGLSSIRYAGIQYALALAAMDYGARWFSQGASPSYLLTTKEKLGRDEVKRIASNFLVEHSGLANSHLPLVIDGGVEVQKISSTPDEAQYLNTLNFARASIAGWFGIPSHLVGLDAEKGSPWGRTVQELGYQFIDFTLSGYLTPIEEVFSRMLPRGVFAGFNENALLRANAADTAAEVMALRNTGVMSKNELRVTRYSMPPVSGKDGNALDAPLNSNVAPDAASQAIGQAVKTASSNPDPGDDDGDD